MICTLLFCLLISAPEQLYGPDGWPDGSPFTIRTGSTIRLYNGGSAYGLPSGVTHAWSGPSLDNLTFQPAPVIEPGNAFDTCGAWLMAAYTDTTTLRGWYHAEGNCDYANNYNSRKTIAYAESADGGLTFVKVGYPDNQIISAPASIPLAEQDDEGDFRIVRNGEYYYLYFLSSLDRRTHLARSLISDGGKPGTWWKWYNGGFTEPGLGGRSDALGEWWQIFCWWVSYNTHLDKWTAFHLRNDGLGLSVSDDGIHWTPQDATIIATGNQWQDRHNANRPLVNYLSMIGPVGNSDEVGREFWIYGMYLAPYETQRYLMRWRVELHPEKAEGLGDRWYLPVIRKGE